MKFWISPFTIYWGLFRIAPHELRNDKDKYQNDNQRYKYRNKDIQFSILSERSPP